MKATNEKLQTELMEIGKKSIAKIQIIKQLTLLQTIAATTL